MSRDLNLERDIQSINKSTKFVARYLAGITKMDADDAYQEMLIEACKAHKNFDSALNVKFSTYAVKCMKNKAKSIITKTMRSEDVAVRNDFVIDDRTFNDDGEEIDPITMLSDTRSEPSAMLLPTAEDDERAAVNEVLDEVESVLELAVEVNRLRNVKRSIEQHALTIFRKLRYETITRHDGLVVAKTVTKVAQEMGIVVQRVASIFAQKIKILGTEQVRESTREQLEALKAQAKIDQEVASMAKSEKKAVKKPVAKKSKAEETVGRQPRAGGQHDKVEWVRKNFVEKGKTRGAAIEGLVAKYPQMSVNYAKTIIYTHMREENWAATERKAPTKTAEKPAAKKVATKKPATAKKATKTTEPAKKASKPKKVEKVEDQSEDAADDSAEDDDEFDL